MMDSNARNSAGEYFLHFDQSIRDLAAMGDALRDGAKVILYMTDEYEVEGVLVRDGDIWLGRPDYSTIRYLDGSQA